MKKISTLMAALTAVTVGGVYAAWVYAEGDLQNVSSAEQLITVANINTTISLKAGNYSITASDDLEFIIDSAAELKLTNNDRYTAPTLLENESEFAGYYVVGTEAEGYGVTGKYHQHEAVLAVKGSITVKFTPAEQAADDIQARGLLTNVYFTNPSAITLEDIKWEDKQILSFNPLSHKLGEEESTKTDDVEWVQSTEDGKTVFTYTYTAAELAKMLTLRQGIILDTSADHTNFSDKLDGLAVKLHVDQANATTGA